MWTDRLPTIDFYRTNLEVMVNLRYCLNISATSFANTRLNIDVFTLFMYVKYLFKIPGEPWRSGFILEQFNSSETKAAELLRQGISSGRTVGGTTALTRYSSFCKNLCKVSRVILKQIDLKETGPAYASCVFEPHHR